jgi:hypothetical protein
MAGYNYIYSEFCKFVSHFSHKDRSSKEVALKFMSGKNRAYLNTILMFSPHIKYKTHNDRCLVEAARELIHTQFEDIVLNNKS